MPLLIAHNLIVGYDGSPVAPPLNFTISCGDYLCIIGENGSGKSTLIRTILGLIPPISGTIEMAQGFSSKKIGYLPQSSQIQRDFPATVREIVLSGLQSKARFRPFYTRAEKETAATIMHRLSLDKLSRASFCDLSGGQRQRVLLARALCATSQMLLLDEPTTGLDPAASADFYQLTCALQKKDNLAIVQISHDLASTLPLATHILEIGETVSFTATDNAKKEAIE